MVTPQATKKVSKTDPGIIPPSIDSNDQLIPMVREIHAAVVDLRNRFEISVADLRAEIGGKRKSHLTIEEVAELTGRAAYTVRSWVKEGLIKAIRIPGTGPKGRLLVPREELQKLVDRGLGDQLPGVAID